MNLPASSAEIPALEAIISVIAFLAAAGILPADPQR